MEHLQGLYLLPKILGIFPFDGQFRLSKPWLAYAVLVRTISILGALLIMYGDGPTVMAFHTILPQHTSSVLLTVYDLFLLLWWIRNRDLNLFLFNSLDRHLKQRCGLLPKCQPSCVPFLLAPASLLVLAFNYILEFDSVVRRFIYLIVPLLSASTNAVCIGNFWDAMALLGFLFAESTRGCDLASVIAYDEYHRLARAVNDLYKPVILTTIAGSFLHTVMFLDTLLKPHRSANQFADCCIIIWIISMFIQTVSIIQPCNKFKALADQFNDDLYHKLAGDRSHRYLKNAIDENNIEGSIIRIVDMKLVSKERLHFHLLAKREISFTAYGLFSVDNALICSMVSAASTYLVITLEYWPGKNSI